MKKQVFGLLLVGFCLINLMLVAQTHYPVKKVNGIEYHIYTVNSGESLFGICKKMDISQEDLTKINPDVQKGIKAGQELLIPIIKSKVSENPAEKAETANATSTPPIVSKTSVRFVEHKVEKKQTLYSICNKYSVNQEDVEKYNPDLKNGLKEGMILKIPKMETKSAVASKSESNPVEPGKPKTAVTSVVTKHLNSTDSAEKKSTEKSNTRTHKVEPGETLYSISRHYKVEVDDLIKLNPESATKLTAGTELVLPSNASKTVTTEIKKENPSQLSTEINVSQILESKKTYTKKKIRIAFLLPFMLDDNVKDATTERFVAFYSGALMAIQQAKQKGLSFDVYSYDTEKSEHKINEILKNSELKTMDLIIGPAYSNQVSLVSEFVKENHINTLIPFTSKSSDVDTNPYLFQFNPDTDVELNFATELFSSKKSSANLIFAEIANVSSQDEGKRWVDDLKDELKQSHRSFSHLVLQSSETADFSTVLKKGVENIVIFNTAKYTQVSPYLSVLNNNTVDFNIVLYEQYHWRNQPTKVAKSIVISPFRPSLKPSELSAFNENFAELFNRKSSTENPSYELLGYDLTGYFVAAIERFGTKFPSKISSFSFSGCIQSQPSFQRSSSHSGFINQKLYTDEEK